MDDNVLKICVVCNTEKSIDTFHKKFKEGKQCKIKTVLKRFFDNKEKIIQQRRDKCARFKDLDDRLKALEEKLSVKNNST